MNLKPLAKCSLVQNSELLGEWKIRPPCSVVQPRELSADNIRVEFYSMKFVTKETSCYLNIYITIFIYVGSSL